MLLLNQSKTNNQDGYLLLEIVLALAIISTSLLALNEAFRIITHSYATVTNYTKAMYLSEKKLYELKIDQSRKNVPEQELASPFERYRWEATQETESEGLRRVQLPIIWTENGQPKEFRIATYVTDENIKE